MPFSEDCWRSNFKLRLCGFVAKPDLTTPRRDRPKAFGRCSGWDVLKAISHERAFPDLEVVLRSSSAFTLAACGEAITSLLLFPFRWQLLDSNADR